MNKTHTIIYRTATTLLSLGMVAGGMAQLLKLPQNVTGIVHLGYPVYFLAIIGTWKLLGVAAILAPKLPLIKEWAYAGFFFAMTGAVISHVVTGDSFTQFAAPLIFALLTIISWHYRPDNKKLLHAKQ